MSSSTLSDLKLASVTFPISDELAGLERLLPDGPDEIERFAILADQTPSILEIRGRVLTHEQQMDRFITLTDDDPKGLDARLDTARALTILARAGQIAQMLVPARTEEDRWAQTEIARGHKRAARHSKNRRDADLLRRLASGAAPRVREHRLDASALSDSVTAMARYVGAILPEPTDDHSARPGEPGAYRLEDARSLEAYFAVAPDLADLMEQARGLLERSDRWSHDESHAVEMVDAARRAALMLAYARLARIGLWPARTEADLQAKSVVEAFVAARKTDPEHLRALALLALDTGDRIARRSDRFRSAGGAEL
ncbi:conserved hypothetical protein [Hyphomicrobiales bacterium]|nr:conserved hypothetical protein [Hyphomicrobiales bacterium]CAH1701475.1 conserved hypothetical protein [Hyphomicrobiales bacterium]CAI0345432.1 conserved hypothetical protein [Hyphomicrobiales bacterium]